MDKAVPADRPGILSESAGPGQKKKDIDELIEEFKRNNPGKNQKKIYRGAF